MSGTDLTIRPYRPADAESVVSVHEAALHGSALEFEPEGAVDEELRNVTETYVAGDDTFLVGTVDGEVAATGGYRERPSENGVAIAEVGHLRVHPDYQRRGYARTMMAELRRRARADGFDRFVLETHEDLPAARALYERLGYAVTKRVPHEVTGDEMIHYVKEI